MFFSPVISLSVVTIYLLIICNNFTHFEGCVTLIQSRLAFYLKKLALHLEQLIN